MITILLDKNNAPVIETNINGLSTFNMTGNPRSVSQLVKLRLMMLKRETEFQPENVIDWFGMMENKAGRNVLGTKIFSLISQTQEVTDVDITNAQYDLDNTISLSNICFTVGCDELEVNI